MALETCPQGVKETRPVWSVLMVPISPETDEGRPAVADSISHVMPEAS